MNLKDHIREIPDFPKPGILFYDISTLLAHGPAWKVAVERLAEGIAAFKPDLLIGIESRGFLVAAPVAVQLGLGFVMARKRGKLPGALIRHEYALEYGVDIIEMQADALTHGHRVVIVDDLIATGGTLAATIALSRRMGATVAGAGCIIELKGLGGREAVDVPLASLIAYDV